MNRNNPDPLDLEQFDGFTPGPWAVSLDTDTAHEGGAMIEAPPFIVAEILGAAGSVNIETADLNAQLIAAAPALLAECQRQHEEITRLRGALTGLFRECSMIHTRWGDTCNLKEANSAIEAARAALAQTE